MKPSQNYNFFTIAHQLKRRIRIIAPSLYRDQERAYILEILLLKREAIERVKVVPAINSVTIEFNPEQFPKENLLNLLEGVLANFSQKPRESIHRIARQRVNQDGPKAEFMFGVGGMSCASCALFLEMVLKREIEAIDVSINYVSETGVVSSYASKEDIFKVIRDNGYEPYSIDTLAERKILLEHEHQHLHVARKRLNLIGLIGLPVMLLGVLPKNSAVRLLQALLSFPVVFWGGEEVFKKSWRQARLGTMNMDTLIAIGASSAYGMSIPAIINARRHAYFEAATAIIGFVQLGRYLEELAKNKMVGEVEALVNMQPQYTTRLQGSTEQRITSEDIQVDDRLLIRPGERIPVDGVVLSGLSSVDESMITGSHIPAIKEKGHELFDGSINGSGVLHMRATVIAKDTVLAGLVHMIDQTRSAKLEVQKTADALSARLMPGIMYLSGFTFTGWIFKGAGIAHAFANAISVLLISCPCALGLATPAATSVSSGQAARRKIYIRNGQALEILGSVDSVIFDKTGTLTEGNAKVADFLNVSDLDDAYVIQLAAAVEHNSEHLLGKAIVEYAKSKNLPILKSTKFHSIPDQGVRCEVEDYEVLLGNRHWLEQQQIDVSPLQETAELWATQGNTLIYLVLDHKPVALFAICDKVREGARGVVEYLQAQGLETMIVTGDTAASAALVAQHVGIDHVTVEASPAEKIQFIRELQNSGRIVAMIGDGINDAPALTAADVSLVVGNAAGVAIEAADFILVDSDIGKVPQMLEISQRTLAVIKQNLIWAFGYNAVAIPVAMAGKLNPMVSAAAMALSSVSVIVNSLRLRKE